MGTKKHKETDIAKQPYKGPSPVVAGLGESVLHGKFLLFTGIALGAIAGAVFPTPVGKAMDRCRGAVTRWHGSENHFVHGAGGVGKWLLGMGEGFVHWMEGLSPVKSSLGYLRKDKKSAHRVATAIDGAIVTSAGLSTIGFFTGLFSGTRTSSRGKKQFHAAQDEILKQRDENNDLRKKLIDTQTELEDERTGNAAKRGLLKVSNDTQHGTPHTSWTDSVAAEKDKAAEASLGL